MEYIIDLSIKGGTNMSYEKHFYEALFQSWERCMSMGLSKDIEKPLARLAKEDLVKRLEKNSDLICRFREFMDKHFDAIRKVKGNYYILLFDKNGCLLSMRQGPGRSRRKYSGFISPGVSFDESSIGTNAVVFAKLFKRPIYMVPGFHYCCRLKKWHEYCIPLRAKGVEKGFVSVVSIQYPVTKALEGFVDLLEVNMCDEHLNLNDMSINKRNSTRLTERQYIVLKMIAEGLSDENISHELKISLSTVKYHNQCIFKLLNATSRVDAVIKALVLDEINIGDLYNVIV